MHILAGTVYMRLRTSLLVMTCCACLGTQTLASTATPTLAFQSLELAQANSIDPAKQFILQPGSAGTEVKTLQTRLRDLGYYDGEIDGRYGEATRLAVSKFQKAKGLVSDGIVGATTRQSLQTTVKQNSQTTVPTTTTSPISQLTQQREEQQDIFWWLILGIGFLGSLGAILYFLKLFDKPKKSTKYSDSHQADKSLVTPSIQDFQTANDGQARSTNVISPPETVVPASTQLVPVETTSRIAKVSIVDQLINDLHNPDPTHRRKAIWDLGQRGDSRAIQPLVELMMDADSQQRSLILAALAEIGTRTLKPMNRALAISLQDESPQVRKNAIRDLTRIYDMMAQVSQMLSHAMHDSDPEVQATAKYALSQMNRIRALPSQEREKENETDAEEQEN